MDFLSIRKKARERAAKGGSTPPAEASAEAGAPSAPAPEREVGSPPRPPAPPEAAERQLAAPSGEIAQPGAETILTASDVLEGELQARFQGLAPSSDSRFATWRPGSGPPPIEPDAASYEPLPEPAPREVRRALLPSAPPEDARAVAAPRAPVREPAGAPATPPDPLDDFFYRPDEDAAAVPALGAVAADEPIAARSEELDEFLTFRLAKEEFAIAIGRVREVLRAPSITEVPRAPAGVLGVVTVRGEVVPVVDAHARLCVAAGAGTGGRIVIVDAGEGPLGVLVDAVESVVRLPRGTIEPCPQGLAAAAAECVTGIGRWRERLFMVVDPGALLRRARPTEGR